MCAAFLDLKAFDSLDHVILLVRLQQLGVCETEFQNYLTDRFQQVKSVFILSDCGPGIPWATVIFTYVSDMYVKTGSYDMDLCCNLLMTPV